MTKNYIAEIKFTNKIDCKFYYSHGLIYKIIIALGNDKLFIYGS